MLPGNPSLRYMAWFLSGLAVLFAVVWQAPGFYSVQGLASYLPLHMLAETFSIVVAMLMFGVAWNAYSNERPGNIVILACALLAVGLIDFVHMLSFKGMPEFVTPSNPEKAINLWLSARLVAALALLAVALRSWQPLADPRSRYRLLAVSVVVALAVSWLGVVHPEVWPRTFIAGEGLTPFKIGAEYAIVAILLVPAVLFYRQARQPQAYDAASLFAATVITILSELSFTLYSDVADIFNLLGHIYKIVAYFFIYRAVFVASVREPFQRLDAEFAENRRMSEELRRHREHLEELVDERTAQLEAANKELEAFSYSVSHDLRTPLRAIDGFSRILLEDYGDKIDDEGKRLLNVVRDNTGRMGQLIDDILQFSRTGRLELNVAEVDMEGLARDVLDELMVTVSGRKPEVEIGRLPRIRGDRAMLRQVFANLLSNAIKFSRGSEPPRIEVGCNVEGKEAVYFVKDNGVGFDMQYVGKLFGVFQRLHGVNEFEGTGIGLAIVKRIVGRHGGRVWAEGKVHEGATIYFALPIEEKQHG